jgi:hypothetical protein
MRTGFVVNFVLPSAHQKLRLAIRTPDYGFTPKDEDWICCQLRLAICTSDYGLTPKDDDWICCELRLAICTSDYGFTPKDDDWICCELRLAICTSDYGFTPKDDDWICCELHDNGQIFLRVFWFLAANHRFYILVCREHQARHYLGPQFGLQVSLHPSLDSEVKENESRSTGRWG